MVKVLLVTSRGPGNWPPVCLTAFHGNKGALGGSPPKPRAPVRQLIRVQRTAHDTRNENGFEGAACKNITVKASALTGWRIMDSS